MYLIRLFLCVAVIATLTQANSVRLEEKRSLSKYDVGTYEYESFEGFNDKDQDQEDGEEYTLLEEQVSKEIDGQDWEAHVRIILGDKEFQSHFLWLQKLHAQRTTKADQGSETQAEVAPTEKQQESSEESGENVSSEETVPSLAPMEKAAALEPSSEETKVKQPDAPSYDDTYVWSSSDESLEEFPAAPLEKAIEIDGKQIWDDDTKEEEDNQEKGQDVGKIIPEFNMKDDTINVPEDGLNSEDDSEIIIETVPAKTLEELLRDGIFGKDEVDFGRDEVNPWISPRLVVYAQQHRNMMLTITIMFFMVALVMFFITVYRTYTLCKELPSATPGSYQRMQEDTDSLYSQKV